MQAAALVENIIDTLELDAEEIVDIGNVSRTLREWLDHHRELTQLTRPFLNAHAQLADNDELRRSEEHTSELQSLMRISYAVFCLKKTKNTHTTTIITHITIKQYTRQHHLPS